MGGTCNRRGSYGNRNFWAYYNNWFDSMTNLAPTGVTVTRIGGSDRYAVAVNVSKTYFTTPGVPAVHVPSGENYPDAIGAGPAAAQSGGPVLFVPKGSVPAVVAAELTRLAPARIVVVGGPASVSEAVYTQLAGYAPSIARIGGSDRFEASRSLATSTVTTGSTVAYLATGYGFADALSSGAAAGSRDAPVIRVDGKLGTLDDATWGVLVALGVTWVYVAGGLASVSNGIVDSLNTRLGAAAVTRFGGASRFAVASAINRDAFATADTFFVSSGMVFPDALSATPATATMVGGSAPLYVTDTHCVDRGVVQHMIEAGATKMLIVGGPGSVNESATRFGNC